MRHALSMPCQGFRRSGAAGVRLMTPLERNERLPGRRDPPRLWLAELSGAELSGAEPADIAARRKAPGPPFAAAAPLGKDPMPIRERRGAGVAVICGAGSGVGGRDSSGACGLLQTARKIARIHRSPELQLTRTLGGATGFASPLDDDGEQVWPKAGDAARLNLPPSGPLGFSAESD